MDFGPIKKLAEYNGKLPRLISKLAEEDVTTALRLLDDWAHGKRPLREIYDDAITNIERDEKTS